MSMRCKQKFCTNHLPLAKDGHYFRKSESKWIQRYRCKVCGVRTSTAVLSPAYGQKKRTLNNMIGKLLCAKVSQRRIAKILDIDKKTVHRKLVFLGMEARRFNQNYRENLGRNIHHLQFDDLITKEITKLKPVTISIAVDGQTRKILSAYAAAIPASGHLSEISKRKYGRRKSMHKVALQKIFKDLSTCVHPYALIRSDKHKFYGEFVTRYFPDADYETYKSDPATVAGQGELKKNSHDPIYRINHAQAMLRDGLNRLVRRSWCVTQSIHYLQLHLEIFIKYYNTKLV